MSDAPAEITRRRLLARAGCGLAGIALAGSLGELAVHALGRGSAGPPLAPRWRSRPDLRIPALTVTKLERGASSEPIFIAPYNSPHGQAGAVIADAQGEPIWEQPLEGKVTTNFRVQRYRGAPVLTWWEGSIELGHGVGEYVIADSAYRVVRRVQAGNHLRGDLHEFLITPKDTALLTSYRVTGADLTAIGGPRSGTIQDAIFQEIDIATGEVLIEWHSLGSVPLEDSYVPIEPNWDFFHINSVDLDHDGMLLVSSRSMQTVFKIDRSGGIVWRLGGKRSDFAMGPGASFAWQHDARTRPDGMLTLFDNGATPAVERRSRGLVLELDEQAMTASLVAQYAHPKVLAGSQGSVQLLPSGNVFVGWGEVPRVTEFDSSGRIVFDALLGAEYECYRAFRQPWAAAPAETPAIAVSGRPGRTTAHASWNGATAVRSWRLLAGPAADAMRPVADTAAGGFETAIRTAAAGPCFAAAALGEDGATLARSPIVTAT